MILISVILQCLIHFTLADYAYYPGTDIPLGACFGYLSAAYAFNASCLNVATCLCDDPVFIETTVGCIKQMTPLISDRDVEYNLNNSYTALQVFCVNVTMDTIEEYDNAISSLPSYEGNKTDTTRGEWEVTDPFKLSTAEVKLAYESYKSAFGAIGLCHKFGAGTASYWGGVLLLHAIFHFLEILKPGYYDKLCNTKCVRNYRKYFVLPTSTQYLPSNIYSLEIAGYIIIVIIFCFAGFPSFSDNFYYDFSAEENYSNFVGLRTGYISLYVLPLMILFAGRNNFLMVLTGLSQDTFICIHRWCGRIIGLLILMHAIAYSISFARAGYYGPQSVTAYWRWGVVGCTFSSLLVVQGCRFLRRRAYETFLVIHIIGAILFIVGGYYHLKLLTEFPGLKFYYTSIALWGFDRSMRLFRIATSNFGQYASVRLDSDMLVITAPAPRWWKLTENPGSYTFIHFLQKKIFFQSHPFTQYINPENPEELKLICRVKEGVTKNLSDMITASDSEFVSKICLDGPYSPKFNFSRFDELTFFAGGIGITAPFSYIQNLLLNDSKKDQRIRLIWAVRDLSVESWFRAELEFLRSYANVEVSLYTGGETEKLKVLNISTEIENIVSKSHGSNAVFCCGPDTMARDIRKGIAANMNKTDNYFAYFEESFSW